MNDYTKFNILGVELEFDFLDLDEKEFFESVFSETNNKISEVAKDDKDFSIESSRKYCESIISLFEELFLQSILPRLPEKFEAALELGWSDRNRECEFNLHYAGEAYNPLEDPSSDEISMKLVRKAAPDLSYTYEQGINSLMVALKA